MSRTNNAYDMDYVYNLKVYNLKARTIDKFGCAVKAAP
jgi:hypothetical protein